MANSNQNADLDQRLQDAYKFLIFYHLDKVLESWASSNTTSMVMITREVRDRLQWKKSTDRAVLVMRQEILELLAKGMGRLDAGEFDEVNNTDIVCINSFEELPSLKRRGYILIYTDGMANWWATRLNMQATIAIDPEGFLKDGVLQATFYTIDEGINNTWRPINLSQYEIPTNP